MYLLDTSRGINKPAMSFGLRIIFVLVIGTCTGHDHGNRMSTNVTTAIPSDSGNNNSTADGGDQSASSVSHSDRYLYGTLSVTVISLSSLAGAVLIPNSTDNKRSPLAQYVITAIIAMGVGILISDALLHLVPQALDLHGNSEEENGKGHPYLGKCLAMVAAIYLLFLFESISHVAFSGMESEGQQNHGHSHQLKERSTNTNDVKSISQQTLSSVVSENNLATGDATEIDEELEVALTSTPVVCCGLRNLALIITLGDTIHNFADGLVIGTSFAGSTRAGIASSLAVFCHELPHELSDFAVLMSTGLTRVKSVMINLFASVSSFAGLYIGLAIGSDESAIQWTMSLTVGMFLFVALGDMMPELSAFMRSTRNRWTMLGVQNAAILVGIGFVVAMAIYETKIERLV